MNDYKSLEQQINELWDSRGFTVLKESVEPMGHGRMKWTIIAEHKEKACEKRKETFYRCSKCGKEEGYHLSPDRATEQREFYCLNCQKDTIWSKVKK